MIMDPTGEITGEIIGATTGATTGEITGGITGGGILGGTIGASCGNPTISIRGTTHIVTMVVTAITDTIIMDTTTMATIATEAVHIHISTDKEVQDIETQA